MHLQSPGLEGKQWQLRKNPTLALQHQATCEGWQFGRFNDLLAKRLGGFTMGHMQKCPICNNKKSLQKLSASKNSSEKTWKKRIRIDRFDRAFPKIPDIFRKKIYDGKGPWPGTNAESIRSPSSTVLHQEVLLLERINWRKLNKVSGIWMQKLQEFMEWIIWSSPKRIFYSNKLLLWESKSTPRNATTTQEIRSF